MNEELLMAIGQKIKTLRNEAGLTQEELAQKCGYNNKSSIAKIEKGKADIPQNKIKPLASALGVNPIELLHVSFENEKINTYSLFDIIRDQYGDGVLALFELITRLDPEDRAEIRGMARLMLMDKKYAEKNIKRA